MPLELARLMLPIHNNRPEEWGMSCEQALGEKKG